MARLDEALARHAEKWMRLSGPKLRDRVDLWVAKFDPAGVRVPPKVDDNRYVEIGPTSPGMAGDLGNMHAADAAALDQRLDALAATVCEHDPRTKSSAAPMRAGRWRAVRPVWPASAVATTAPPRPSATRPRAAAVIHVLAEQATVDGTVISRAICPGLGYCRPSRCASSPPPRSSSR